MYFSKFQQFNYLFLFFLVICMQLKLIVQEVNIPMLFISGAFLPQKVTEHFFVVGDSKITVDHFLSIFGSICFL